MSLRDRLRGFGASALRGLVDRLDAGYRAANPAPPPVALPPPDGPWQAVCAAERVKPGVPGQFPAHGAVVAVFRVPAPPGPSGASGPAAGSALYAVDNGCQHEDGPLGEGRQDGAVAICPYHDWRYDLPTGRCLTRPGRRLGTWEVREDRGFIWIGAKKTPSSDERGGEHGG